jgi:hypothetical protein
MPGFMLDPMSKKFDPVAVVVLELIVLHLGAAILLGLGGSMLLGYVAGGKVLGLALLGGGSFLTLYLLKTWRVT